MGSKSKGRKRQLQKSAATPQPQARFRIEQTRQVVEQRVGPIPPPEDLARYNELIPNGADRIMALAETQAAHRQQLEKTALDAQIRDAEQDRRERRRGQSFALLIGIAGIGAGAYVILQGNPIAGSSLGGFTLVSLVTAFIVGRRAQPDDEQK